MFHTLRNRIYLIDVVIYKICKLADKRIPCTNRIVCIGLHGIHITADSVACRIHIVNRFFNHIMKLVDGIAQRLRFIDFNKRFHLPNDTADIFPSINSTIIGAKRYNSRLTACDAAYIVACMFIPYGSCVGTS